MIRRKKFRSSDDPSAITKWHDGRRPTDGAVPTVDDMRATHADPLRPFDRQLNGSFQGGTTSATLDGGLETATRDVLARVRNRDLDCWVINRRNINDMIQA